MVVFGKKPKPKNKAYFAHDCSIEYRAGEILT